MPYLENQKGYVNKLSMHSSPLWCLAHTRFGGLYLPWAAGPQQSYQHWPYMPRPVEFP